MGVSLQTNMLQGCEQNLLFLFVLFSNPESNNPVFFVFFLNFGRKELLACIFARSARKDFWCTLFTEEIEKDRARSARSLFGGVL